MIPPKKAAKYQTNFKTWEKKNTIVLVKNKSHDEYKPKLINLIEGKMSLTVQKLFRTKQPYVDVLNNLNLIEMLW